jgi:hypothetical protein
VVNQLSQELVKLQNSRTSGVDASGKPLSADQYAKLDADIADVQGRLDYRNTKLDDLAGKSAMAQQAIQKNTGAQERKLMDKALNDPSKILKQAKVPKFNGDAGLVKNAKNAGNAPSASAATAGGAATASGPRGFKAATMDPALVSNKTKEMLKKLNPAEGELSDRIKAAQGDPKKMAQLKLEVSKAEAEVAKAAGMDPNSAAALGLNAAQTTAGTVGDFGERTLQQGELIDGSAVDQSRAAQASNVQAAQGAASQDALMRGQMAKYMQDFEGGKTPAWAAGAMRQANEMLAARGLGASSMAGQAVVQAAMESAMPLAQADAATIAQFERDNLSNRQQAAMASAQLRAQFLGQEFDQKFQAKVQNAARIADIANINFTAKQQVALENSRIANSVNLANLSARNAKVLADAATLSQIDLANLENQQQSNITNATLATNVNMANLDADTRKMLSDAAAMTGMEMSNIANLMTARVNNAKNFLEMDLANLSNEQQTELFKFQTRAQSLLSDQSAKNMSEQFNAASENQVNSLMTEIASTVSRFNAEQTNDMRALNVTETNSMRKTNTMLKAAREEFNANFNRDIKLANAKWKQEMGLAKFDAETRSNSDYAKELNGLTTDKIEQLWMKERDIMAFAFSATQNEADRDLRLMLGNQQSKDAEKEGWGRLAANIIGNIFDW